MTNTTKTCVPDKLPTADPVSVEVSNKPPADVPMTNTTKTRVSDDLPTVKVSDKPPAADTVPVSDKPPVSPTAHTASDKVSDKPPVDDDVPMSKPVRSSVTAKVFCTRLSKTYDHLPFPNFSETGKDWDSKAKAHLRSHKSRLHSVLNRLI